MKIVKFDNGKYALRKWSWSRLGFIYKDLSAKAPFWWSIEESWFKDCLADSEEELRRKIVLYKVVEKIDA